MAIFAVLVFALAGCGSSGEGGEGEDDLTKVTLIVDYVPGTENMAFYAAAAEGYYTDRGLDVEILPGKGSTVAASQVASDSVTFGYADFSAVAAGIGAGQPIKVVAGIVQRSPTSLAYLCPPNTVDSPEDIKGMSIANAPGSSNWHLLNAFLAQNGLSSSDYEALQVDDSVKNQSVLSGRADATLSYTFDTGFENLAEKQDKEVCFYPLGANGLTVTGYSIIASNSTIESKPDLVRDFVAASVEGWEFTIDNPSKAADHQLNAFPEAVFPLEGWEGFEDLLHTPQTSDRPIGFLSEDDVEASLALFRSAEIIKEVNAPSSYFTNDFLPK